MDDSSGRPDFASAVARQFPALRRYARALCGSQEQGDEYALAALRRAACDPRNPLRDRTLKVDLFRTFHQTLPAAAPVALTGAGMGLREARAHWRLQGLNPDAREALLLHAVEGFFADEIATILSVDKARAEALVEEAHEELGRMVRGRILIVEDEAVIAMDLQGLVESMGHTVTGIAGTRQEAVDLGRRCPPDLILSDIQLADRSSGIDAVAELFADLGTRPAIFVTAFPERLLTGNRPEPAFLITKPYSEEQVRAAISQAMFFATTEAIEANAA